MGSTQLNDKWQRSFESFYDTFEKKLTLLESTCGHPVPDRQKMTWLKHAITPHPTFNSAYVTMQTRCTIDKKTLQYGELFQALHLLSTDVDKTRAAQRSAKKAAKAQAKKALKANAAQQVPKAEEKDKKNSSWWIEPEKWKAMSKEERKAHLDKKYAAQGKTRSGNRASQSSSQPSGNPQASTPAPAPVSASPAKLGLCFGQWSLLTVVPELRALLM